MVAIMRARNMVGTIKMNITTTNTTIRVRQLLVSNPTTVKVGMPQRANVAAIQRRIPRHSAILP